MGDITADLPDLLVSIDEAAKAMGSALSIITDEVQCLSELDLPVLIMALHRCNQKSLPVILFGAGLPQLRAKMGDAKSYVERLFDFPQVDALPVEDVRIAIEKPANGEGVRYTPEALDEIIRVTACYPYFIQEWGHHAWAIAQSSPITLTDVTRSHDIAELGPGSHRSGDIAKAYGAYVIGVAPLRSGLIAKGMIYSPAHGDTAFTVPLFDEFMRREMPG